uniref:PH domain-containing protein n=1 Tax=Oncorhynchus tshawytscha TaxID=74940 RepID=A0A8C8D6Z6_ONCTS
MSSKDNPCRKFQANIFNKSKCQNCFKPRESHLLSDEDLNQAKPIYGGWLLLAPEGTNFGNPLHRSRKWQRRFFILYEHGLLRYALDEMPSTLPQGTINMNQCSDVIDGESRTGQKNSLCVLTPDREHFIRAECREIINGWQEALTVYPRTNKQNQKKKRKVEPPTPQEPGPAKVTVTSTGGSIPCLPSSIASAERVPASRSTLWQEERWSRASTIPCSRSASCLSQLTQSHPGSSVTREGEERLETLFHQNGSSLSGGRKVRVESGYFSLEKTKSPEPPQPPQHQPLTTSTSLGVLHHRYSPCDSPSYPNTSLNYPSSDPLPSPGALLSPSYSTVSSSQSSLDSEPSSNALSWDSRGGAGGNVGGGGGGRVGRPGKDYVVLSNVPRARRLSHREAFRSDKKRVELRARTRSPGREEVARLFGLERRRSQVIGKFESGDGEGVEHMDTTSPSEPPSNTVSPDLLNFKKGWMTKLYEDGMWKKHCVMLILPLTFFFLYVVLFQAADMDGEIDLSTCYDVTEFPVQRNYGFQILSKEGACTLSAMTSGIRRNWIQAIMKNARPTIAPPDVTRSLLEEKARGRVVLHPSPQPGPDPIAAPASEPRKSRVRERRREGRSKTYDWSEFQPGQTEDPKRDKAPETVDPSSASSSSTSSSSSSTSSLASSPISTTSSPPTSSSISAPPPGRGSAVATREESEQERGRRRDERPQRFKQDTHDQGRMEVDHPEPGAEGSGESDGRAPDVQVEIEQRWHQVETTPLREEKQVPISTTDACLTERLPPQELAALLDKELGQTQKELARLQEQNNMLQEQLEDARGREHSAREGYVLQATCERGFTAMEETHHKVVEDLQRQHQREVSKLLEEKERLLAEETAATIAAIEAMKNAHREEMEKNQRSQISGLSTDIDELHEQYQEELQSIQRELEVLSEQYSQKCLENAHLAQALEAERQALRQCQRENQELNAHNQELNNRLTVEITRMRSCYSGETALSPFTQGKDLYELEVLLRIKESEIQYLKQEIHSLKDELQSALRDKKYATDKYKDIYTELSIVKAKADCDITKLTEKLLVATEALGDRNVDGSATPGYDIMKSKSNPDFLKKERSTLSKQIRGVRSKVR